MFCDFGCLCFVHCAKTTVAPAGGNRVGSRNPNLKTFSISLSRVATVIRHRFSDRRIPEEYDGAKRRPKTRQEKQGDGWTEIRIIIPDKTMYAAKRARRECSLLSVLFEVDLNCLVIFESTASEISLAEIFRFELANSDIPKKLALLIIVSEI
jgi:hypothetical protein